jgi:hypothetical protein
VALTNHPNLAGKLKKELSYNSTLTRANFTIYLYLSVLFYKYNNVILLLWKEKAAEAEEFSNKAMIFLSNAKRWTEKTFLISKDQFQDTYTSKE